ncbi:T9SS type A sorting domain-containing protein [Rhodocytophaga rosea]|uniref:T9SS type A sorting domain-containing protein n=1 Tax=Rhodocytophaga rosea TaxID=2704465 RepID=A0A6C0GRZ6_9BACT|nr:T9SS type A sorting domain-containing protein [Rhodocytophaga rosea]QHT70707.1 T9SS type A sorting domain-containing protein [Rhodocytophaga rosea]
MYGQVLDYHWVGAVIDKSWDNLENWKTRPRGSSGVFTYPATILPGQNNDVYFDENSFDLANDMVLEININNAACRNMDWTQATSGGKDPKIDGNGYLSIYGSLLLEENVVNQFTGTIEFKGINEQIITAGTPLLGTVIFNNSLKCTLGAPLFANNIIIEDNSILDVSTNNYKIEVKGNWNGKGTFIAGRGSVTFNGIGETQSIYANPIIGKHEFYNLTIDKPIGNIRLDSKVSIGKNLTNPVSTGSVSFYNGIINSSAAYPLIFNDNTTFRTRDNITGIITQGEAKNTSYVNGSVQKTGDDAFTLPTGKNGFYRPIGISELSNSIVSFIGEYFLGNPYNPTSINTNPASNAGGKPINGTVNVYEHWTLTKGNTGNGSNARIVLSWDTPASGPAGYLDYYTNLVVANYRNNLWENKGGKLHNENKRRVTATEATNNSQTTYIYTLGSIVNALPIELLYFKANLVSKEVQFSWATAKEVNNDYFTIEKSADGIHFDIFIEVDGAGNSQEIRKYSAIDASPYNGVTYYRLKQTDLDNKFEYSKTIAIHTNSTISNTFVYSPESNQIHISYGQEGSQKGILTLHDSKGVLVWSNSISEHTTGATQTVTLPVIASGLYIVSLQQENQVINKKIIVP